MIHKDFRRHLTFSYMVGSLQGGLRDFCGFAAQGGLHCRSLEWNGHYASQHLALHSKNRTHHPVQLPDLE